MLKKVLRSLVVFFTAMLVLTGCSSSASSTAKSSSKPNQIVVTYQLKENGKAFANKKITQPKKSVVMTGLKMAGKSRLPRASSLRSLARSKMLPRKHTGCTPSMARWLKKVPRSNRLRTMIKLCLT